jgi:type VI secretion system protein ImpJ
MSGLVNWYEGQFLQPHQFQLEQRRAIEARRDERRLVLPFDYGIIEAELVPEALAAKKVRFRRLVAVMKSGTLIDIPGNTDLEDLPFDAEFNSGEQFVVKIGLPEYLPSASNTIGLGDRDRNAVDKLFREKELKRVGDDNTGENEQSVMVRRYNARLAIEGQRSDSRMEWLPLVRIKGVAGQQRQVAPVEDPSWIPTCLTLSGSAELSSRVRGLIAKLEKVRSDLVDNLKPGYKVDDLKPDQPVKLMRLRALTSAVIRLKAAEPADRDRGRGLGIPVADLYVLMSQIMGDLASLHPEHDPMAGVPKYNHDQPGFWYFDLEGLILQWAWPKDRDQYWKLPLAKTARANVLQGELTKDQVVGTTGYYIGIRSPLPDEQLDRLVKNTALFKVVPNSEAGSDYAGVRLAMVQRPIELPHVTGLRYFRIERGATVANLSAGADAADLQRWQRILTERKFAVVVLSDTMNHFEEIAMYGTIP